MKMRKPTIVDAANDFINGGREEAPVVEEVVQNLVPAKKKPGRKPNPNKAPIKYISLRVSPEVHESLLEYTFKHRTDNVSMNTYVVEALEDKMKKDGLL